MSENVSKALELLNARAGGRFDGCARFVIEDEGTILLDGDGARAAEGAAAGDADVTLTADADTFRQILEGDLDATAAYMSGRLKIDGDLGKAMQLGAILA